MTRLKAAWRKLPNWAKAGINTGTQSAVGTFVFTALGWLHDVQRWFGAVDHGTFPAVEPVGKAAVSVVLGALIGLGTAVYRKVHPGPRYSPPPG